MRTKSELLIFNFVCNRCTSSSNSLQHIGTVVFSLNNLSLSNNKALKYLLISSDSEVPTFRRMSCSKVDIVFLHVDFYPILEGL